MERGYKFRIYPTPAQEILIAKTLGCCRYVWNHYLDLRKEKYATDKKNMGYHACCKDLTSLKKNLPWLNEVDSTALQSSLQNLEVCTRLSRQANNGGAQKNHPRRRYAAAGQRIPKCL